jgi:hypothetical protein
VVSEGESPEGRDLRKLRNGDQGFKFVQGLKRVRHQFWEFNISFGLPVKPPRDGTLRSLSKFSVRSNAMPLEDDGGLIHPPILELRVSKYENLQLESHHHHLTGFLTCPPIYLDYYVPFFYSHSRKQQVGS